MYLLPLAIHSVFLGTLALFSTRPVHHDPNHVLNQASGTIDPGIAAIFKMIGDYMDSYENFQRTIDETPKDVPGLYNRTLAFFMEIQGELKELTKFTRNQPSSHMWLFKFWSHLPKLYQNLDDLIELARSDYGEHLYALQTRLEELGAQVWKLSVELAEVKANEKIGEVIGQIQSGSYPELPQLPQWDETELLETIVVLSYKKGGFANTLRFVLSLKNETQKASGLTTLHLILFAKNEVYDQSLIFVLAIHFRRLAKSTEATSMPTTIQTMLSNIYSKESAKFNYCLRSQDLYCCLQIAPTYPLFGIAFNEQMMTCLGKSELEHFKTPPAPIHLYTYDSVPGLQINSDQTGVQLTFWFEECRYCNCAWKNNMTGIEFFCPKSGSTPSWNAVLKRGNGYQLQNMDRSQPSFRKWAGICQHPSEAFMSVQPNRVACFVDQPQTLYTSPYPPTG